MPHRKFSTGGKLMLVSYFLQNMSEFGQKMVEVSKQPASELEQPIWSVVSFERAEASGLTYAEAAKKLSELEQQKVSGLCIITDEAAARVTA
jgi:hypothetical protein